MIDPLFGLLEIDDCPTTDDICLLVCFDFLCPSQHVSAMLGWVFLG